MYSMKSSLVGIVLILKKAFRKEILNDYFFNVIVTVLSALPNIDYAFTEKNVKALKNIVASVFVEDKNLRNKYLFKPYVVFDADTPESVAYQLYDDPNLWWVLIVINDINNPFTQWIKDSGRLSLEIKETDNQLLWFMDTRKKRIVDDVDHAKYLKMLQSGKILPEYINPVFRRDYENALNEKRNHIWVLEPSYVYEFAQEYEYLLIS
nr:MAG TPA: baseplate wedge subunit [Caudoviricetes sp.]